MTKAKAKPRLRLKAGLWRLRNGDVVEIKPSGDPHFPWVEDVERLPRSWTSRGTYWSFGSPVDSDIVGPAESELG